MATAYPIVCPIPPKPFNHLPYIGLALLFGLLFVPLLAWLMVAPLPDLARFPSFLCALFAPFVLSGYYCYQAFDYRRTHKDTYYKPKIYEIVLVALTQIFIVVISAIAFVTVFVGFYAASTS